MTKRKNKLEEVFDINSDSRLSCLDKESLLQSIIQEGKRRRRRKLIRNIGAVAAVCIGVLIFFHNKYISQPLQRADIRSIAHKHSQQFTSDSTIQIASLELQQYNTSVIPIKESTAFDGEQLVLSKFNSQEGYSTLYIPYGKRREVILPDGSMVWLNSGSYFTYRNNFEEDLREVYLNGEAFFDIKRNGKQFVVRTAQADIMVLGTSFNASSYEDDDFFSIELLTGKVELNSPRKNFSTIAMNSGDRVMIDFLKNNIRREKNSLGDDVLWTKRQLALKNVTMGELLKRMERIYNIKINALEEVYKMDIGYSGRLNVAVDIEKSLQSIYELRNYDIRLKEKEVLITKKK